LGGPKAKEETRAAARCKKLREKVRIWRVQEERRRKNDAMAARAHENSHRARRKCNV
jgi:hypothetical protein